MRDQWKNNEGYFTVEASFIVPTVLFCIFGVLFLTLYLYDLGIARSLLTAEVVQISDVVKTDAQNGSGKFYSKKLIERSLTYLLKSSYPKRAAEGKNRLEAELKKKLIVSKVQKISLKAGQQTVKGSLQISLRIPIPVIGEMTGALWKNNVTVTIENGSNAEHMRRWSLIE